ncbi:hypothetical protein LXL04_011483 [Taraxacum kok-saghyz]
MNTFFNLKGGKKLRQIRSIERRWPVLCPDCRSSWNRETSSKMTGFGNPELVKTRKKMKDRIPSILFELTAIPCGVLISTGRYLVETLRRRINKFQGEEMPKMITWCKEIPIKVIGFVWKAAHGRIPTASALLARGVPVNSSSTCSLCGAEERADHILVNCPVAVTVRDWVGTWTGVNLSSFSGTKELLLFALHWGRCPKKRRILNMFITVSFGAFGRPGTIGKDRGKQQQKHETHRKQQPKSLHDAKRRAAPICPFTIPKPTSMFNPVKHQSHNVISRLSWGRRDLVKNFIIPVLPDYPKTSVDKGKKDLPFFVAVSPFRSESNGLVHRSKSEARNVAPLREPPENLASKVTVYKEMINLFDTIGTKTA